MSRFFYYYSTYVLVSKLRSYAHSKKDMIKQKLVNDFPMNLGAEPSMCLIACCRSYQYSAIRPYLGSYGGSGRKRLFEIFELCGATGGEADPTSLCATVPFCCRRRFFQRGSNGPRADANK
jgi:hypothetical protein